MTDDDIKAIASAHLARPSSAERYSADIVDFARAIERAAADEAAQSDPDFFTVKIKRNVQPDTINDLARAFFERQDGDEVDAARFRYLIFQADELWATGLFENGFTKHEIIAMIDRKRAAARALLVAPNGWQLAPKIPNESMEVKGAEVLQDREGDGGYEEAHRDTAHCVFRAMLEGAPVPPPRDREADRARYTDPAFNEWLDDSAADGGATVWDLIPDVHSAWFAWTAHPNYAAPAAPQQAEQFGVMRLGCTYAAFADMVCSECGRVHGYSRPPQAEPRIVFHLHEPVMTIEVSQDAEGRYSVTVPTEFPGLPVGKHALYLHPPAAEVQRLREALKPFAAIDLTTNQAVDAMDVLRARRVLEGE